MKTLRRLNLPVLLLLALALPLGFAVRAQEDPPAPPVPPAETKTEAAKAEEAKPAQPEQTEPAAAPSAEKAEDGKAVAAEDKPEAETVEPAGKPAGQPADQLQKLKKLKRLNKLGQVGVDDGRSAHGDRVRIADDVVVGEKEIIRGDAVAVLGDVTVNGEVHGNAVAVLGDNTVRGTVNHDVVAVMGDLTLGPKARVDGNVVCVGGEVHRDPGAVVNGEVTLQPIQGLEFKRFSSWWDNGLKLGRPLAIGAHLGWLWIATGFSIAVYALLALLFPQSVRRCGDKLVQEPGLTVLAAVLSLLALPVLFVLLCITIIGIPIALLLLPLALLLAVFFGKASIYALVGRKLTGDRWHLALATLLGALGFIVLYLVPVVGLLLSLLVALIGFGAVVLVLFSPKPKPALAAIPPPPPAASGTASLVPPPVPALPLVSPGFGAGVTGEAVPPPVVPPVAVAPASVPPAPAMVTPPVIPSVVPVPAVPPLPVPPPVPQFSAATLPRAGFWIRVGAAFLDFILVFVLLTILFNGILHVATDGPGLIFFAWIVYHPVMWKLKGTTIGGVICGLRVVRLDDRPIDWTVAIVRSLTAFLSMLLAGLGFIWVAFDDEKQSWHDKVAGTTIVRVPKGTPLL